MPSTWKKVRRDNKGDKGDECDMSRDLLLPEAEPADK
jgi:hypothetical protein